MGLLESLDGQPPAGVGWEFDGYSLGFLKLDMVGKRCMFFLNLICTELLVTLRDVL